SADSGQNGTVMRSGSSASTSPRSRPLSPGSNANCQLPFRLSHSSRTKLGRGYSGRGIGPVEPFGDGSDSAIGSPRADRRAPAVNLQRWKFAAKGVAETSRPTPGDRPLPAAEFRARWSTAPLSLATTAHGPWAYGWARAPLL